MHDHPIGDEHHPVGVSGGSGVVRDEDEAWSCSRVPSGARQDLAAVRESRLPVGSSAKITGADRERACDRDPLLLAAGQLCGR